MKQTISRREAIVQALTKALAVLETNTGDADTKVYRNLDKPLKLQSGGIVIVRDNYAAKEVDVLLSPLSYRYELMIQVEVVVQHQEPAMRNYVLDMLLMEIDRIISVNRTLYGLAEWLEAKPADFQDEPIEGAATVRSAAVPVIARYNV